MLHRGFQTRAPELGSFLIHSAQATAEPPPLLLEETEIRINWQWCLRLALIHLVGWLVLFAVLFLIAIYMQDGTYHFLEQ